MKSDQRFALICLFFIAIVVAGVMVEKFWHCRLTQKMSQSECLFTGALYVVP